VLDPALGVVAQLEEVDAARVVAREAAAHARDDELSLRDPLDPATHGLDAPKRFVAEDEEVGALGHVRLPALDDLPVGPADTNAKGANEYLAVAGLGLLDLEQLRLARSLA